MGRRVDRRRGKNDRQIERRLAVQYAVSCVLLEARSLDEVAFNLLQIIGHDLTWDIGLLWMVEREKDAMCCHTIWQAPSHSETIFEQVSRRLTFPKGLGLPGQVWTALQPLWCRDILEEENFPRHEAAAKIGLHTALAFPIRGHSGVLGVMEFYRRDVLPPDADLLRTVITLGHQFGQFLERLRAEETVRTSEIRKAAILQTAIDAIIMIDYRGIIIEWNAAAERLFGYSHKEAIGQEMVALIVPPALRSQHTIGFARYLVTEEPHILEQRIEITALRANGQEFPIELTITRIPLDGPPIFTGYLRDISERKRLELSLVERASEVEGILEAMMDGLLVFDRQARLVRTNAAARYMLGIPTVSNTMNTYSLSALLPHHRWLDEHDSPLLPEDGPISRVLRGEELIGSKTVDVQMLLPDGQHTHFNVSGAALYDLEKGITGGVCVFRDVSERRSLEQRISDALKALLSMAEALMYFPEEGAPNDRGATDGMQSLDEVNIVVKRLASLAFQVLGCQHLNILSLERHSNGQLDLIVVGAFPEQLGKQQVHQRYTLPAILDFPFVRHLQAKEVQVIDMEQPLFKTLPNPHNVSTVLLAPMCIRDALVGILALDYGQTDHDYTSGEKALAQATANFAALVLERQRLLQEQAQTHAREIALFESNRRMDEFLSITSHELKTPLTAVIGNIEVLEMLLSQMVDDATCGTKQGDKVQKTRRLLQRAQPQLWRLNRLIDDLLDVSRIQANKLALLMEPCNLVTIVQQEIEELRQINPARSITLRIEAEAAAIPIYAHADRISQVVTNFITNALKYSADDKAVTVVLQKKEGKGCCAVYDKGTGLSPDEQERIWERFYRVQGNAYRNGSSVGLGLGLYISRTIIEQHQGQVGVQSTLGEGACFWFTLPLATPVTQTAEHE